jgi:hypothetical protein
MAIERRIKTIERHDGKARLFILERDDGCYRFEGEAEMCADGHLYDGPCFISGLYASANEAERAAEREVPWLRVQVAMASRLRGNDEEDDGN